jgi:hypothetical protein
MFVTIKIVTNIFFYPARYPAVNFMELDLRKGGNNSLT